MDAKLTMDAMLFSIWLLYVVIKDVVAPLVKYVVKRKSQSVEEQQPVVAAFKLSDANTKFAVLEVDLAKVKTQIIDLKEFFDRQNIHLDNKLDLVLDELKTIGNRLTAVEIHVQHILGRKPLGEN